jgi:antitoxin (DNA-binding transcriptional repressor) of toxin-antitoxin stability system
LSTVKSVGIRELKNRLSEYVREVRGGEEILVTDRGEVVAELRRPTPPEARAVVHPGLAALARRGILILGTGNSPDLYAPLPPIMASGSAAELLAEEREDRR